MAASNYTRRLRAMEYAIASSNSEDTPQDVVTRAQVYADWLDATFSLKLRYETDAEPIVTDAANILPMKPKGKLQ